MILLFQKPYLAEPHLLLITKGHPWKEGYCHLHPLLPQFLQIQLLAKTHPSLLVLCHPQPQDIIVEIIPI